jgi:hypothetical protein
VGRWMRLNGLRMRSLDGVKRLKIFGLHGGISLGLFMSVNVLRIHEYIFVSSSFAALTEYCETRAVIIMKN